MTKKEAEYLEFMRGKITAMEHILAALVALHADSTDRLTIAKGLAFDTPETESLVAYRRGLEDVVKLIDETVRLRPLLSEKS